jgi:hypothetical protein
MDKDGKLGTLRLSFDDGQAYEFRRAYRRPVTNRRQLP